MKEKVYINRVSVNYETLYARVQDYFHRHGIEIDFEFIPSDYKNLSYTVAEFPQGQRIILQPTMSNIVPIDPVYDFTSFVFNGREFPPPNIPTGYCYVPSKQPFIDILTDELNPPDLDYVGICHEHMHALVMKANQTGFPTKDVMDIDSLGRSYYNNMNLESADSNFGEQWNLLSTYLKSISNPMSTTSIYLHFNPTSDPLMVGLKDSVMQVLDKARTIANTPFKITSGFRTPQQNQTAGGEPNSAHLRGLAADIACTDSTRQAIMRGFLTCGIPVFTEDNPNHIHVDVDSSIHTLGWGIVSQNG